MSARDPASMRTSRGCRLSGAAARYWTAICTRLIWTEKKMSLSRISSSAARPKNRDPLPEERAACLPWLREQFRLLRPKIVVCLGRIAAQQIIRSDYQVTKEHGQFVEKDGVLFMGTFHPAALLRNPNNKPVAFEDFAALREKIREICTSTY